MNIAKKEQRENSRKNLMYYVSVYELDSNEYVGLMVDISKKGMLLTGVEYLDTGKSYRFGLIDISEPNAPQQVSFQAKACWCRKSSPTFYDTGFEFEDVTNQARERFESFE